MGWEKLAKDPGNLKTNPYTPIKKRTKDQTWYYDDLEEKWDDYALTLNEPSIEVSERCDNCGSTEEHTPDGKGFAAIDGRGETRRATSQFTRDSKDNYHKEDSKWHAPQKQRGTRVGKLYPGGKCVETLTRHILKTKTQRGMASNVIVLEDKWERKTTTTILGATVIWTSEQIESCDRFALLLPGFGDTEDALAVALSTSLIDLGAGERTIVLSQDDGWVEAATVFASARRPFIRIEASPLGYPQLVLMEGESDEEPLSELGRLDLIVDGGVLGFGRWSTPGH